jgi:2-amino-4-hydroxy-6-hydroxymethyldihydropteridine diphosphokinase
MIHHYLIALGSNQRHPRHGSPTRVVQAALVELDPLAASPIITSRPIGPSQRSYANAAAIMASRLAPDAMLADLKAIEHTFGRRPRGQKWRQRVLDLDIILWSGGIWTSPGLGIPHRAFRERVFVLQPACAIAGNWRDPVSGLTVRHLWARLGKAERLR